MTKTNQVNIDYGPKMDSLMTGVQRTLVQEPGYQGVGGHDSQNHGPHGQHSQVNIGINNSTINLRRLEK